jgi:hypothetical protein
MRVPVGSGSSFYPFFLTGFCYAFKRLIKGARNGPDLPGIDPELTPTVISSMQRVKVFLTDADLVSLDPEVLRSCVGFPVCARLHALGRLLEPHPASVFSLGIFKIESHRQPQCLCGSRDSHDCETAQSRRQDS